MQPLRTADSEAHPIKRQPAARKMRRGPSDHLRDTLVALSGGHAIVANHAERAWASITFEGARHTLSLVFEGTEAVAAGEDFIAALPDHEFTLHGQLVADAVISSTSQTMLPQPHLTLECEILLLRDC